MKKIIARTKQRIRMFLILRAHRYLRANGFVCLERHQWASAMGYCWNVEQRIKKIGGGNASKLRNRQKQLRRLAHRFREYLEAMDTEVSDV